MENWKGTDASCEEKIFGWLLRTVLNSGFLLATVGQPTVAELLLLWPTRRKNFAILTFIALYFRNDTR